MRREITARFAVLIVVGALIIGGVTCLLVRMQTGELEKRILDKGRLFSSILGAHLGRIAGENIKAHDALQAATEAIGREHELVREVSVIAPEMVVLSSSLGKGVWEPVGLPGRESVLEVLKTGKAKSVVQTAMGMDLVIHFMPIFKDGGSGELIGVMRVMVEFPFEQGRVQSVRSNLSAYFRKEAAGFADELAEKLRDAIRLAHRNFTYIDELVAQMSTDDEIENVRIFSLGMRMIGSSSSGRSCDFITFEETTLFKQVMEGGVELSAIIEGAEEAKVEMAGPLYVQVGPGREIAGAVGITLSLNRMRELAAGRRNLILAVSVVTFVAFCLMVGLVYKARSQREIQEWSATLQQRVDEATRELEKKQAQLLESAKLAGLGVLSSGIAHEINNPLGVVLGDSQMLLEELAEKGGVSDAAETRELLEAIERNAKRCSQIVKNLLQFARGGKMDMQRVVLSEVLDKALEHTADQRRGKEVEIDRQIDDDLPVLRGSLLQLEQVFTNILMNAMQSIDRSGRVSVAARRGKADEMDEGAVIVSVTDTGGGISDSNVGKIFEPFFTTKEPGDGVGLGLSVSYGIVKAHGGDMRVESAVGSGTTITVILPLTSGDRGQDDVENRGDGGSGTG